MTRCEEVSRADAQIPKTALPVHQICAGCICTVSIAHGVVLYLHCKYLYCTRCVAIEVIRHIVQFLCKIVQFLCKVVQFLCKIYQYIKFVLVVFTL